MKVSINDQLATIVNDLNKKDAETSMLIRKLYALACLDDMDANERITLMRATTVELAKLYDVH